MDIQEFVRKYNIEADAQQLEVIKHAEGAVNLIATAGSGKTRTIINRIGYMTRALGIAPESILAVTFTVAAAREMKERFRGLLHVKELPMREVEARVGAAREREA